MRSNGDVVQELTNVAFAKVQINVVNVLRVVRRALLRMAFTEQLDQTGLAHVVGAQQADLIDI